MKCFLNPVILLCVTVMTLSAQSLTQGSIHVSGGTDSGKRCHTDEYMSQLSHLHPDEVLNKEALEAHLNSYISQGGTTHYDKTSNTLTIPVVVHVIYRVTAESISAARIQANIDVLNQDYNKLNADISTVPAYYAPRTGSMGIRFELASLDPSLQMTDGITYTETTVTAFGLDNKMKYTAQGGRNIWDRNNYMNIWVCRLSGSVLGYAQLPGGPANSDGIVIDYRYFGALGTGTLSPYNRGRTATHEVGHWLGLYHIWGDATCGDDLVNDTPVQEDANYGCPGYPKITCNNGATNNTEGGDMFMNFMDYTNDACMKMFTAGQVTRMTNFLSTPTRSQLLSSYALNRNSVKDGLSPVRAYPNPSANGSFRLLEDEQGSNRSILIFDAMGKELKQVSNDEGLIDLSTYGSGVYFMQYQNSLGVFHQKLVVQ
jgi:hypothetical protein